MNVAKFIYMQAQEALASLDAIAAAMDNSDEQLAMDEAALNNDLTKARTALSRIANRFNRRTIEVAALKDWEGKEHERV